MYMKSESVLPFYSLIETDPQAQDLSTSHVCKRIWSSFLCEFISAALIFASVL